MIKRPIGAPHRHADVLALYASGWAAQQQGRLDEAEALYMRVLALDPSNFDSLYMLAVTRFQAGDFAGARERIRAARAVQPDVPQARHNLKLVEDALRARETYWRWITTIEKAAIAERVPLRAAVAERKDAPRLSLVLPTYNSPPRWLAACLDSVLAQTYPHWELCLADDASTNPSSRETIARYAAREPRIRVVWRAKNGHISAASNSALSLATAPFIALLDHDDVLPAHALAEVALALVERPDAAIIYTDEDKLDEAGQRFDPYFKPDWNPALATSQNFVSHLGVYRTELVCEVGGFRVGFEGAQDWDLLLRCVEHVAPERIIHVPQVLYHWRSIAGSTASNIASKGYAKAAQERTVWEHTHRRGMEVTLSRVVGGAFLQVDPVVRVLPEISLVVLHSPSMPPAAAVARWRRRPETATAELLPVAVSSEAADHVDDAPLLLGRDEASAINAAAAAAHGELLVFVAAGAEPAEAGWLARLAGHALQPDIGCVSGVTFDALYRTVRSGYVLDPDAVAVTVFAREPRGHAACAGRNQIVQNLSALCLAGLALRRIAWEAVGGLDAVHLAAAYHDVDLCLRLAARGLRHVWHPGVVFVDGRTLRDTEPARTLATIAEDAAYMRLRYGTLLAHDAAYNPHLSRPPHLFEISNPDAADPSRFAPRK